MVTPISQLFWSKTLISVFLLSSTLIHQQKPVGSGFSIYWEFCYALAFLLLPLQFLSPLTNLLLIGLCFCSSHGCSKHSNSFECLKYKTRSLQSFTTILPRTLHLSQGVTSSYISLHLASAAFLLLMKNVRHTEREKREKGEHPRRSQSCQRTWHIWNYSASRRRQTWLERQKLSQVVSVLVCHFPRSWTPSNR